MESALIEQVRSFNRSVTERVGALNDHFLGRNLALGEARLLWEIGNDGAEIRALRSRLALDSAYVSRLLRSLEKRGLVEVQALQGDRRVRRAQLTTAGLAERAELDQRSDEFARSLLEPLSESQQARLAAAMNEVERLLLASTVEITITDPENADAKWCLAQYFAEIAARFESGFQHTQSYSALAREYAPPTGLQLVVRLYDEPVGCGALRFHDGAPTELKRVWIDPKVRGLGVGRRLILELERHAKDAGADTLRLDTNRALTEAIALYRRLGYYEIAPFSDEPYAHYWFEKRL